MRKSSSLRELARCRRERPRSRLLTLDVSCCRLTTRRACGSSSTTASRDSAAPRGFPGRFRTNDFSRTPQSARLRAAMGVFLAPSKRMRSAMPSSRRLQTARVASGVTSRCGDAGSAGRHYQAGLAGEANDAPAELAADRRRRFQSRRSANFFRWRTSATAGPERSARSPRAEESLTVRTAAVRIEEAAAQSSRRTSSSSSSAARLRRGSIRPACAGLPSAGPACSGWWSACVVLPSKLIWKLPPVQLRTLKTALSPVSEP